MIRDIIAFRITMRNSFIKRRVTHYYHMTIRFIISVIVISVLIACAFIPVSASAVGSDLSFGLEEAAGAENEYLLSCDGADDGPAGIFITFPGAISVVSTTLPENRYQVNENTISCALVDDDTFSLRFLSADLRPGTVSLAWEEFADGTRGETVISVSDAGCVSVSSAGDAGETAGVTSSSPTPTQSPVIGIVFLVIASLVIAGCCTGRERGNSP